MEDIKKQAEVLNVIAGSETNATVTSLRQIMFGYSQYIIDRLANGGSSEIEDEMRNNLYLLNTMIEVLEKDRDNK